MTELTLSRNFNANPERVFDIVTKTENIAKWWGPEGVTCPVLDIDLTKPGPWVTVMKNSDGGTHKVSGEVTRVDPPNEVEFTWGWHDDQDQRGHESRLRFTVAPDKNGGSTFLLTHSVLASEDSRAAHEGGWTSSLVKLEALFTKNQS